MTRASPSDSKTLHHHSLQNWHSETEALFTMYRGRAEDGDQDGGRRIGARRAARSAAGVHWPPFDQAQGGPSAGCGGAPRTLTRNGRIRVRWPPSGTCGGTSATARWGEEWLPPDLHVCTDARKTPGSLPLSATFRAARRSSRAERIAPHVESTPEDRNRPKRFTALEKPRGSDRTNLPRRIAAVVHYV